MKPIISVEGLGKKYVIRHEGQTHYKSLREEIFQLPKKLFRRQDNKEEFWALKDVSFDIMPGDRVGIIGRNGAGKSTLLKLLSRITEPSAGRITMRGRVASLLEVGTGFHPELTGRENIFLNGAILGMARTEIARKFEEIVNFAGVERFLDTPVKRYSSGMYVRLAFAVAAHLEPEILIVDEVLAVGDIQFQNKCLGKMRQVGEAGRTVIFVSHNMGAMKQLCERGFFLEKGEVVQDGAINASIAHYFAVGMRKNGTLFKKNLHLPCIQEFYILDGQTGMPVGATYSGQSITLCLRYAAENASGFGVDDLCIEIVVKSTTGDVKTMMNSKIAGFYHSSYPSAGVVKCSLLRLPLMEGDYSLDFHMSSGSVHTSSLEGVRLVVGAGDYFGFSHVARHHKDGVYVPHTWSLE